MTQADAAAAIGISRSHLASIERGHDLPGRETLVAFAQYYKVPLDLLASTSGEPMANAAVALTQEEALMLSGLRAMPEGERRALVGFILERVRGKAS